MPREGNVGEGNVKYQYRIIYQKDISNHTHTQTYLCLSMILASIVFVYYFNMQSMQLRTQNSYDATVNTSVPFTCRVPPSLFARFADCFAMRLPN